MALFFIGLIVIASIFDDATGRSLTVREVRLVLSAIPFPMCGVAWIVASWFYWRRRYKRALLLNLAGIGISVVIEVAIANL
ncbi:MAG: hypothetical protein AAGG48_27540 [Planctomycetota bacterium]